MYADRYGPKPVNPGSLSLSVSIVGGLLAAVMLSPTVIDHVRRDKVLEGYVVPPPAPPPPPDLKPEPEVRTQAQRSRIDPPEPLVPTVPQNTDFIVAPDPGPPIDLTALEGTGGGVTIDPPKPPPPVLVGARPDPRVDYQPTYPTEERRAGNEGVVTLRVLVGVDGRVRQVERIASASEAFWRVTQDRALSKWRFRPATRDGVPYETWRTMTVRFRLETE